MYLETLHETEQAIHEYNGLVALMKSKAALSENLVIIAGSLQTLFQQMESSAEAKKTLVPKAGMTDEQKGTFYSQLHQLMEDLDDGMDVSAGSKDLHSSVKAFSDDENQKWKDAVDAKAGTQISLLQQLGKYTDDPSAASSVVSGLIASKAQMPKSAKAVSEYGKMLDRAQSIVKKVGGTPAVMDFLHKLNIGQATLSDLNDEILAWIRERKMENKMRITF